ncbi:MAG: c-type cytochrome [Roseovarius sp.]|jgi:mono/diheme cytochrome c family protein
MTIIKTCLAATFVAAFAFPSLADSHNASGAMMASELILPEMNAEQGRRLFAAKGCVVCHSINGVGGADAPLLDAEFMDSPMNPFEFAARMWRGAEAMVELQRDELGDVIEQNGEELAAIIAFVHDPEEQARFSNADIPEDIEAMMGHIQGDAAHKDSEEQHD